MKSMPLNGIKVLCILSESWTETNTWLPLSFDALSDAGAEIAAIHIPGAWVPESVVKQYPLEDDVTLYTPPLRLSSCSQHRNRLVRIASNLARNAIRYLSKSVHRRYVTARRRFLFRNIIKTRPKIEDYDLESFYLSIYDAIMDYRPDIIWVLKGWYLDVAIRTAREIGARIVFEHSDLCFSGDGANENLARWMPYEAKLASQASGTIVCAPGYIEYYQRYAYPLTIERIAARWLTPQGIVNLPSYPHRPLRCVAFGIIHRTRLPERLISAFHLTNGIATLHFQGEDQTSPSDGTVYHAVQAVVNGQHPTISASAPIPADRILDEISEYDVGIVLHDTDSEGRVHCLTTKVCTYLSCGLVVLSIDTPGMRAGLGDSEAVIYLKDTTVSGIAEGIQKIAAMSDEEIMHRKHQALELARRHAWDTIGKAEYIDTFTQALKGR